MFATVLLCSCSRPSDVSHQFSFNPANKNKGAVIMSLSCQGLDPGTRNYLFYQDLDTSQIGRMFNAGVNSDVLFHCESAQPQYKILVLPAGHYAFTNLSFNRRVNSLLNVGFDVTAHKVTYIGRLHLIAAKPINPSTIMGSMLPAGTIRFRVTNNARQDFPYFKKHYPRLNANDYRVRLGNVVINQKHTS
jgi:hypothetical protein